MKNHYPVIIVGAGQAGLACSFYLKKYQIDHIVLEQSRVANSWHQRWDSFKLVTPNWMNTLPGAEYDGDNPDDFLTKSEVLNYFDTYAKNNALPIQTGISVKSITKDSETNIFSLTTSDQVYFAQAVIICCGLFQSAYIPEITEQMPQGIKQIHSSNYKNPSDVDGNVMIIGSGLSGMQIAKELSEKTDKSVYFSLSKVARMPISYRGQLTSHWIKATGVHDLISGVENDKQEIGSNYSFEHNVGIVGGGSVINIKDLITAGVTVTGRTLKLDNQGLYFKDNLYESLEYVNTSFKSHLDRIDEYIKANHITAPLESVELNDYSVLDIKNPNHLTYAEHDIKTIIWATGYKYDFSWIKLPAFNALGQPRAYRGISPVSGLYFCGMPHIYKNKSGFINGVGELAEIITHDMIEQSIIDLSTEH